MINPWSFERWRFAGLIVAALLLGWMFNAIGAFLAAAFLGYGIWHLRQLVQLERWLREGARQPQEIGENVWGAIAYHIHRLQEKNLQSKKRLTAYLNRFHELNAAHPDGVVLLKEGVVIEWFNESAARLLGLRMSADRGYPIVNLVRDPCFVEYLAAGDYSESVEITSPRNEDVHVSIRLIPYGTKQYLLVVQDITRLHRLEQIRRDFVANVSHELRTPLTVLRGYLEAMQDSGSLTPEQQKMFDQMLAQSGRMQSIVEDLLLLSRLENGPEPVKTRVDVPVLLERIKHDAEILSGEKHHRISLEAEPGLFLEGNEGELMSAFSNLVNNAVRYTPEGGSIAMCWYRGDDGIYFDVKDSGIGIRPEHIGRLTERFYRVDVGRSRQSGGTGLGLAIVKHVLERHHATLIIESEPGKGSLFRCRFAANANPPARLS
ncbi:MAG: phosphate regulon sensor histidine kinase PhoR [Pseudomonadota bacterium]